MEDPLYARFRNFDPAPATGDSDFMARLTHNLLTIEAIRAEQRALRRRYRRATLWAASAGFVCGFLCCLALPRLSQMVGMLLQSVEATPATVAATATWATWMLIAAVTLAVSAATYDLLRPATQY